MKKNMIWLLALLGMFGLASCDNRPGIEDENMGIQEQEDMFQDDALNEDETMIEEEQRMQEGEFMQDDELIQEENPDMLEGEETLQEDY